MPIIDRKRPGSDYRHILKQKDVQKFISLIPEWPEISKGLNAIVLSRGELEYFGYHISGAIYICAWEKDYWISVTAAFYESNKDLLCQLCVPCEREDDGGFLCKFDENTARAHQLLNTFLHELGHHHDRMTTKAKVRAGRGERYADTYARNYREQIWARYNAAFKV